MTLLAVLLDALLTLAALGMAARARFGAAIPAIDLEELRHLLPFLLLIRLGALHAAGLYRRSFARPRGLDFADLLQAWAAGTIILAAAVFFGRFLETSRLVLIYEALLSGAFLVGWRAGLSVACRFTRPIRAAVLVGDEALKERLNRFLEIDGWGWRIARVLPSLDAWRPDSEETAIFLPMKALDERLLGRPDGVAIYAIPEVAEMIVASAAPCHLGGQVLFELGGGRRSQGDLAVKRLLDIAIAGPALIVAAPVILIAALIVKATSPGPAFFSQERLGRGGRPFRVHKLRTMAVGAAGPAITAANDPRVTMIGRFLRASSLDELPQFFDVLLGRMSLVGPRPEVPELAASWPAWRQRVLDVPPGLTGLVQVFGRDELTEDEKGRLDLYYVLNRSLEMDLSILIRTLRAVFRHRGRT